MVTLFHQEMIKIDIVSNVKIYDLEEQSNSAAEKFFENARKNAQEAFEQEVQNLVLNLEKDREEAKNIYLKTTQECVLEFQEEIDEKRQELIKIQEKINQEIRYDWSSSRNRLAYWDL